jgi:probable HAF family extracellular repeat protein
MRHARRLLGFLGLAALASVATMATTPARAGATFESLGRLSGDNVAEARGVSADGSVVVGVSETGNVGTAFRWTRATGMQPLSTPPRPANSYALDVSPDGSVAVGAANDTPDALERAVRWPAAGGVIPLSARDFALANAVSRDGSVIVGEMNGEAFRWTDAEGVVRLGFLNPNGQFPRSGASDISADGRFIVGSSTGAGGSDQAFRWTRETGMVALSGVPAGAVGAGAVAVSNDGKVIAGAINTGTGPVLQSFRWTEDGGLQLLRATPPGDVEYAQDISGDGRIIVGNNASFGAFMWDAEHGVRQLDLALKQAYGLGDTLRGWTLNSALAISDDGRSIVGNATDPSGQEYAYLVVLPEPSSAVLLVLATAAVALPRRVRA